MFDAPRVRGKLLTCAEGSAQCPHVRRVLVVDDEPLVALMIRRTLEPACEVVVRNSGRAALELIADGQRFDAILSDLRMAAGDGPWLQAQVTNIDPAQARRMIFLSGAPSDFLDRPGVRWLSKPFRAAELTALVEEVASASASVP